MQHCLVPSIFWMQETRSHIFRKCRHAVQAKWEISGSHDVAALRVHEKLRFTTTIATANDCFYRRRRHQESVAFRERPSTISGLRSFLSQLLAIFSLRNVGNDREVTPALKVTGSIHLPDNEIFQHRSNDAKDYTYQAGH